MTLVANLIGNRSSNVYTEKEKEKEKEQEILNYLQNSGPQKLLIWGKKECVEDSSCCVF